MSGYSIDIARTLVNGCLSGNNAGVSGFADYVRRRREQLGKPQGEIADAADISRPYVSQIESGKIALPNADLGPVLAQLGEAVVAEGCVTVR